MKNIPLFSARILSGLTVTECAKRFNVSRRTWQRWESGQSAIPAGQWFKLVEAGFIDEHVTSEITPAQIRRVIQKYQFHFHPLHERLGVSPGTVYRWSSGKALPARRHWPTLKKLFLSLDN